MITEEAYDLAKRRISLDREVLKLVERGMTVEKLKDSIDELAIKLDVEVKKSLSLYPTKDLVHCLRNPIIRKVASLLAR